MFRMLLVFAFLMIFVALLAQTAIAPALGAGTSENPYQIASLGNLHWISLSPTNWNNYFIQTANIDASPTETWFPNGFGGFLGWQPIGNYDNRFQGYYDGQGFTIDGLYCNYPNSDCIGLFGRTRNDNDIIIRNLGLTNVSISGRNYVGALVGYHNGYTTSGAGVTPYRPRIHDCYSTGFVNGEQYVGGLVGCTRVAVLWRCYSTCNVSGTDSVGGLSGDFRSYAYTQLCYSTGNVNGVSLVGGFTGYSEYYTDIRNCYSIGNVNGTDKVGGFIGHNYTSVYSATVASCYSTGLVTGVTETGGFAGCGIGTFSNCYWDTDTSGLLTSSAGLGRTTAQLKQAATYTSWDFSDTWWMAANQTRPILREEYRDIIRNSHQLQLMLLDPTQDYELESDIDMSGTNNPCDVWGTATEGAGGFVPIGTVAAPLTGSLAGNKHHVSHLYINRETTDYQSLLGYCSGAEIASLSIIDSYVKGQTYTGGLASFLTNFSAAIDCSYQGELIGTWHFIGGLVGNLQNSSLNYCYTEGTVDGSSWTGGLVGKSSNSCTISNCYSRSSVEGNGWVGGLIGGSYTDTVSNCYSTGFIIGYNYTGGLMGEKQGGTATGCFWDVQTSTKDWSAGGAGVMGKTTLEMTTPTTFTEAGWDFSTIWAMNAAVNNAYPYLIWAPEIIAPDAPTNLVITYEGEDLILRWDAVAGAGSYQVYSSATAGGVFSPDSSGVFDGITWTAPLAGACRFYQVTAIGD